MKTLFRFHSLVLVAIAGFTGLQNLAVANPYNAAVLANGPISYQELNEVSGTVAADATGNGHNGTYVNSPTLGVVSAFPNLGTAVGFNGSNTYVQIPDNAAYDLGTGNFSVELWFKPGSTSRGDLFNYKGGGGDFGFLWSDGGSQKLSIWHNGSQASTNTLSLNEWHQAIYSRNGTTSTGQWYIDGFASGSPDANNQSMNISHDLLIGSNHDGSDNPAIVFNGPIDEVAVYGSALTQAQAQSHYNAAFNSVGVNFSGGQNNDGNANPLAATDFAGVTHQLNWNNAAPHIGNTSNVVSPTAGSLVDNHGTAVGTTISWTSNNNYAVSGATPTDPDAILMNGYLDLSQSGSNLTQVTVTNVPYGKYDVIAYVGSDGNNRIGHAYLTDLLNNPLFSSVYFSTSDNPFGGFVQATGTSVGTANSSNYIRFSGLTGGSFILNLLGDTNNVGLHGLQFIQTPEPSSLVLAGLGLLGLVRLARRRRNLKVNAVLAAALMLGCSFGSADAATISVNFEGGNNAGAPTAMLSTDTAGVAPYAAANWNNFIGNTGTSGALVDSTGAATGVTITVVGADLYGSGTGTGDANSKMLNGYVDGNNDVHTNTWIFNNVPAGNYTLISYALPDNLDGRQSEYSVNGGTAFDLKSDANASYQNFGYVQANGTGGNYTSGNYVRFLNVSPDGLGQITLTGTGVFRNYSNGIQLVPVPEPSSLVMAGLGAIGALAAARRRRSK